MTKPGYYWALHLDSNELEVVEVTESGIARCGSDVYCGFDEFVKIWPRLEPPEAE